MRRRGASSIAANPVLIGAATTLVIIVAVFLAYNANNGLPFVPTYQLNADVPNAANLVRGNDVRMGGARVGVVDQIDAVSHKNGVVSAKLKLKLQTSIEPLPKNSTILVRSKSALGLKYLEITKGDLPTKGSQNAKNNGFADGATIPLQNATPDPVEIDEVFNTFDKPTRIANEVNLTEFANALAGRGQSLNDAISLAPPLLANLIPVAQNLSDPATRLNNLFPALERTAALVAPVADQQADLFVNLDTTFSALADVARPFIQDSITNGVPAQEAAIRTFPFQRVFLANTEQLVRDLKPGVKALKGAAPAVSAALVAGTPALLRSVALNQRLTTTFNAIKSFSEDPRVSLGLGDLTTTVQLLNPTLHGAQRPASSPATTSPCGSATWPPAERGRRERHLAAVHRHRHAAGPQQRGRPVGAPRRTAPPGQPPAQQPLPEHRRARARTTSVRRQREVPRGADRHRQPARQSGHAHDETKAR